MALDLHGQQRFLDFPLRAAIGAIQKNPPASCMVKVLAPSASRCLRDVVPRRLQHARNIHAPVLFEVLVFGGQDRVFQDFGNLLVGNKIRRCSANVPIDCPSSAYSSVTTLGR